MPRCGVGAGGPRPRSGSEERCHARKFQLQARGYEHIKEGAEKRGTSTERAKEIAARTADKERAHSGESGTLGTASLRDPKSASERGGELSHSGAEGPTKDPLHEEARRRNVDGRSSMNKEQLRKALGR
ncbi:plasmid stabilization protein [Streptomyces sp. NPDC060035]|uniref:plasmid stabilization protein n=1 Tax=Streptomyces sp. NPDC060035 TaxID=3347044 RepID=UPI0036B63627